MNRRLLAVSALLALASGCTHAASSTNVAAPARATLPLPAPAPATPSIDALAAEVVSESPKLSQKPGDFVVYKFTGSFRKEPITLTQRVLEVKGWTLVVEYTLKDGARKRTARVTLDKAPGAKREIVAVIRVEGATQTAMSEADLDKWLAETVLAADANESTLGTENVTVAVGGKKLDCTKTTYRVLVGKKKATMSSITSAGFAWGDVGGEIKADDGKLLYRAEVIDAGSDATRDGAVARTVDDE